MYVHHLLLSWSLFPEKSNENLIRLCCKLTLSCNSSQKRVSFNGHYCHQILIKQLTTGLTSPFLEARLQARITVRASILNYGLRDGPSLNGIPNFGLRDGPSLIRFEKFGLRAETVLKFGQKGSDRGPVTSRAQARFNSSTT